MLALSTTHYRPQKQRSDEPLKEVILKFVAKKVHAGFPRVLEEVRDRLHMKENHKRVARVYRELNLQISKRPRKARSKLRPPVSITTPTKPNELWAMDFVQDSFACGRKFRCFNVKDLCTHEAVIVHVARSISGGMFESALVYKHRSGPRCHRNLAKGVQRGKNSEATGQENAERICQTICATANR